MLNFHKSFALTYIWFLNETACALRGVAFAVNTVFLKIRKAIISLKPQVGIFLFYDSNRQIYFEQTNVKRKCWRSYVLTYSVSQSPAN